MEEPSLQEEPSSPYLQVMEDLEDPQEEEDHQEEEAFHLGLEAPFRLAEEEAFLQVGAVPCHQVVVDLLALEEA